MPIPFRKSLCRLAAASTVSAALFAGNAAAQEAPATRPATRPASLVSESQLRADVSWLADDARTGRGIGTPGLDASADYLADRFKSLGLQPLDGLDGYFQSFDYKFGSELVAEKTDLLADGGVPLRAGVDFEPLGWSAAAAFKGPLVFGGYAISSERYGYDDFAGLDAKGKVVLCLRYEPHDAEGNSRFTNGGRFSREAALNAKARAASAAGAVALLIVDPPRHHKAGDVLMDLGSARRQAADIPVFHLKRAAADDLLKADGLPDVAELQAYIDKEAKPASAAGNGLVVAGGFETRDRTVRLRNVAAVLPGEAADEYVAVGAHYDHLGYGAYGSNDGEGRVHNGADDNASGTSVVLAAAKAFAKSGKKPPRTMIFICFTGEEIGLVGSEHFVENCPVPTGQIAAMLNLDMVGRVRDERLSIGGLGTAAVLPQIVAKADAASPLVTSDLGHLFDDRSDQASFIAAGIPSLFLFSGMHEQYHAATDDVDLVNFDGLAQVARFACDVLMSFETTPRADLMIAKSGPSTRPAEGEGAADGPARRVVLGVTLERQPPLPGIAILKVAADSAAARGGIQDGDRIMKFGDRDIHGSDDLIGALAEAEPGQRVEVLLYRDGQVVRAEVTFGE